MVKSLNHILMVKSLNHISMVKSLNHLLKVKSPKQPWLHLRNVRHEAWWLKPLRFPPLLGPLSWRTSPTSSENSCILGTNLVFVHGIPWDSISLEYVLDSREGWGELCSQIVPCKLLPKKIPTKLLRRFFKILSWAEFQVADFKVSGCWVLNNCPLLPFPKLVL